MVSTSTNQINLFCSFGTLNEITDFGQALTNYNVSCRNEGQNFRFTSDECSYSKNLNQNNKVYVD